MVNKKFLKKSKPRYRIDKTFSKAKIENDNDFLFKIYFIARTITNDAVINDKAFKEIKYKYLNSLERNGYLN